jgi:mono/diheme cytochrome c family protein
MKRRAWIVAGVAVLLLVIATIALVTTLRYGFSALDEPTRVEAAVARTVRHWAAPSDLRGRQNPIPLTPEVLVEARAHFADHCAICHGNDGKGQSGMGKQMYPKTPDMTGSATQRLSDGEMFSIIENGVRLSGMPAFGSGTAESAAGSWTLVHFIRHLPKITSDEIAEMEKLNPKSPEEWQEMQQEAVFLAGGDTASTPALTSTTHSHHH